MRRGVLYCRSVDITGEKEYNYEYEGGRIVRATEAEVGFTDGIVTSKVIVNTIKYSYDAEGSETVNGVVVNSMEYDNYGNITKKNGKVYTYDSVWKDHLTDGQRKRITSNGWRQVIYK